MTALPPSVEHLADQLVEEIERSREERGARWQLSGPPTAGKSACLKMVGEKLAQAGFRPIVAGPPGHALDSGPVALMQIAQGLKAGGLINGQSDRLVDPTVPWVTKSEIIRSALSDPMSRVVLLCDEPRSWAPGAPADRYFAEATSELVSLITASPCPVVMTGFTFGVPPHRRHELRPGTDLSGWLDDAPRWGMLADAARALADLAGPRLARVSPLEVRLLVALAHVTSPEAVERGLRFEDARRGLAARLATALRKRHEKVLRLWARLAVIRTSFPSDLIDTLAGGDVNATERDIVRYGLLYGDDESLTLHDTLRRDGRQLEVPSWAEEQATHRALAEHYRRVFAERGAWAGGVLAEMEAFHHASKSGDQALCDELRVFFVVQLDALGRRLSIRARREQRRELYGAAATIFERALELDPGDDYAHHYLAFNLDVEGKDAQRVEEHYRQAVELQSNIVYWWSRYVTFLITRGRMAEARRAWDDALDALGIPENGDDHVYLGMHTWVARLLIHRGQLDFAEEVIAGVPAQVLARQPGLQAIVRRLGALLEARDRGAYVPGWNLKPRWWEEGNQLVPGTRGDATLVRWWAARVDAIDENVLHLKVASPTSSGDDLEVGALEMPFDLFDAQSEDEKAATLEPGRFLEIGTYEPGSVTLIRVHRNRPWRDDDLPPLWPDPARYLVSGG